MWGEGIKPNQPFQVRFESYYEVVVTPELKSLINPLATYTRPFYFPLKVYNDPVTISSDEKE